MMPVRSLPASHMVRTYTSSSVHSRTRTVKEKWIVWLVPDVPEDDTKGVASVIKYLSI